MDSQMPTQPHRLSALYQYHNAPEVAPTQGLEFDDTNYPVSDKYPVAHHDAAPYERKYTGKHAFESDNRPPRIIFGMKVKTFLLVALLVIGVVVGAAVGGAVGGRHMNSNSMPEYQGVGTSEATSAASSSATPSPTAITSTYAAPTPTYSPLSDCPRSNATAYNSTLLSQSSRAAGLSFTKYCDLASPLQGGASGKNLSEAFTYTFNDCIELCAALNFYASDANCTVAVYEPNGRRPANCFVGYVAASQDLKAASLAADQGSDVALLSTQS